MASPVKDTTFQRTWLVLCILAWCLSRLTPFFALPAQAADACDAPIVERQSEHAHDDGPHTHGRMRKGDSAYSLLMHHAAGGATLAIGALMLLDRVTSRRYPALRIGAGWTWILLGVFLFVRADPEGWPMEGHGFMASWTMPTSGEWLQHKLLSLIPMMLGVVALAHRGLPDQSNLWNYVLAVLAVAGAVGLMNHQHLDHPGADIVNWQHRGFAATAVLAALCLVLEVKGGLRWNRVHLFFPICLVILGLQLVLYVE